MTAALLMHWGQAFFHKTWPDLATFSFGFDKVPSADFHVPIAPLDELIQNVMNSFGLEGDLPYFVLTLVAALVILTVVLGIIEIIHKGMSRVGSSFQGTKVSGGYSDKQLKKFIRRAVRREDWRVAAELSEDLGSLSDAARYYQMAGYHEKAGLILEQKGDLASAASCYSSIQQYDKAASLYVKTKDELSAATMFEKAKNYLTAAVLYEKTGKFETAASMLDLHLKGLSSAASRDVEMLNKCGLIYERAGQSDKAADFYLQAGALKKAAELYEKSGNMQKAAVLFERSRDFKKAADLYEKAGDSKKAGEMRGLLHSISGDYNEAAERYLQAEDYLRAAECFSAAGQHQKAAETYSRAGYGSEAAESYARAGLISEAAGAYEKSGNYQSAASMYEKLADFPRALECYRRAGRYYRAGNILIKMERYGDALGMFDSVEKSDPDYLLAQSGTGICLYMMNNFAEACTVLEKALSQISPDSEILEPFYTLGLVYERLGRRNDARQTYRKIFIEDESYRDVKERLRRLTESLSKSPATEEEKAAPSKLATRYEIVRELGRGGMGVVSHAKDKLLERDVALKQVSQSAVDDEEMHVRFLREARAASRLNHPNIVSVYDVIEDGKALYIAMEYVDGASLSQYMRKHPKLSLKLIIAIVLQVAEGLQSAHSKGVVHRDIKPDNILLTRKGQVKITDFGIAHVVESSVTNAGVVMGTMKYMSPEQVRGEVVADTSDLYSLGIVMYEMLTGSPPFVKGDITYHHVHTTPAPPRQLNPDVPEQIEKIVLKCLAKDTKQRYATARDLIADLKSVQPGL